MNTTHTIRIVMQGIFLAICIPVLALAALIAMPASAQAAETATLSGRVFDGGRRYPLYAEIKVKANGETVADVWTGPTDGAYRITLPTGTTYDVTATAYLSGFNTGNASLTLSRDTIKNFPLTPDASCTAPGYGHPFQENFDETSFPPPGWSVTNDSPGSDVVWRTSGGWYDSNYTLGSGQAPTAESFNAAFYEGYVGPFDTSLISPPIPVGEIAQDPTATWVQNVFFNLGEILNFDISTDGGNTWTNVDAFFTDDCNNLPWTPPGCTVQENLGPYLPPTGDVQLRWRYYNNFDATDWYVQLDNVHIGASCVATPGALVAGRVLDANTHRDLVRATVSDEGGNATRTAVTGSGKTGYFLFEPSGEHTLTAGKTGYQDGVRSVRVAPGGRTKTALFALKAGQLLARPTTLTVNAPVNSLTNVTLHVGNRGSAPADWQLASLDAPPPAKPHGGVGAPLHVIHCNGSLSPAARGGSVDCAKGSDAGAAAPNDTGWTAIADYPAALQDQCAAYDQKTNLVYAVGGLNFFNGNAAAALYAYDPNSDTYSHLRNPPTGIQRPVCAVIEGRFYVADGWTQSLANSAAVYIYDPATDSWSRGADNPAPTGGAAAAAVLDDKLYVIGGCVNGQSCPGATTVEVYDPASDSWSAAADYPHPDAWQACGTLAGVGLAARIYCVGGVANGGSYSDGYAYDPGTNGWKPIADLPTNAEGCTDLWGMAYADANGQLLVQDGVTCGFNDITNEGFAYDPARDTWSSLPNALYTLYRGAGACGFYQFGGSNSLGESVPYSEKLPGYDLCGTAPVPWLSFGTASGTLAPKTATTSILTIDGTGRTPGTQSVVQVRLSGNTPYGALTIPLTVNWVAGE